MIREYHGFWSILIATVTLLTGCQPTQPFFIQEDGDLSHYLNVATEIDYPDVEGEQLDEVLNAQEPLTLNNSGNYEMWDLSLEEVTRIALANSKVMRQVGGRIVGSAPETISRNLITSGAIATIYDPALVESGYGGGTGSPFSGTGVEAALAEFDAQFNSSIFWQKNNRQVNALSASARNLRQDTGAFTAGINKTTAAGTQFSFTNRTNYDSSNASGRAQPSGWSTVFEAGFDHPLLQGRGAQYNRIAGPLSFSQYAGSGGIGQINGVMISRIRQDVTLTEFEGSVRNLMRDIEQSYWELFFAYHDLQAKKAGSASALATWKKVAALFRTGSRGGSADREAQSRHQHFLFKGQVQTALTTMYRAENRLRYIMGLAMSDGRLIRPLDEPTTARASFSWAEIHTEGLVRRVEIRKQKWQIKRRELELIAARNHMLPRLDAVGRYRWNGAVDYLIDSKSQNVPTFSDGSNAFESLTTGDHQDWEIGLRLNVPIGMRKALSGVRHHQILLARERALLQDLELEISHQIGEAVRNLQFYYELTETNWNRQVAAEKEVQAVQASYAADQVTLDLVLDAQRRRAEAESAYYRSLVDYNLAIAGLHYRKGSLLEYNGVLLAEGPWPGKANFDAMRLARKRDAAHFINYGFTRPNVISRGPVSYSASQSSAPIFAKEPVFIEKQTEVTILKNKNQMFQPESVQPMVPKAPAFKAQPLKQQGPLKQPRLAPHASQSSRKVPKQIGRLAKKQAAPKTGGIQRVSHQAVLYNQLRSNPRLISARKNHTNPFNEHRSNNTPASASTNATIRGNLQR